MCLATNTQFGKNTYIQLSCVFMESLSKRRFSTEILFVNSGPYSYLPNLSIFRHSYEQFRFDFEVYYWFEVFGRILFKHTHTLNRFYVNIIFIPDSIRFFNFINFLEKFIYKSYVLIFAIAPVNFLSIPLPNWIGFLWFEILSGLSNENRKVITMYCKIALDMLELTYKISIFSRFRS